MPPPRKHKAKRTETIAWLHRYQCNCTVPANEKWANGWIVERSDKPTPGYHGARHWSLPSAGRRCQGFLRSVGVPKTVTQDRDYELDYSSREWAEAELDILHRTKQEPTLAMMWCDETKEWYSGACRHGLTLAALAGLPVPVRQRIQKGTREVQNDANCFGLNCAEVECVFKAYAAGRKKTDLTGCIFVARNKAGLLSACLSCRTWIGTTMGKYCDYREYRFQGIV